MILHFYNHRHKNDVGILGISLRIKYLSNIYIYIKRPDKNLNLI